MRVLNSLVKQPMRLTIIRADGMYIAEGGSMYVCICNRYRGAEISRVARSGVRCARAAYSSLGNGPRCGRCLEFAQNLIDKIHEGAEQHRECSACTPGGPKRDAEYPAAAPREHYPRPRIVSSFATATTANPQAWDAAAALVCDD